ncbi:MAG: nucleotidyltransferase domain-containing protein [Caldilinea sp. CFX5]|nr:nucleotidyltransferase domain-containing protein [Caldilinea sp. CFX5]
MDRSFNFDTIDQRTKRVTPALIHAVTDRIVQHLQPDQVLLFGSQADGRATKESDIDLLVVVDNQHQLATLQHRNRARTVLDLFRYRSFSLDAIVLTEAEIQQLRADNEDEWNLVLEILATGKPLYERAEKAAA